MPVAEQPATGRADDLRDGAHRLTRLFGKKYPRDDP
jgi:hypothetical protein